MSVAEVERFEEVGRGVTELIWVWKCVKKTKDPTLPKPAELGHPKAAFGFKGQSPVRISGYTCAPLSRKLRRRLLGGEGEDD